MKFHALFKIFQAGLVFSLVFLLFSFSKAHLATMQLTAPQGVTGQTNSQTNLREDLDETKRIALASQIKVAITDPNVLSLTEIYRLVNPSVVNIEVKNLNTPIGVKEGLTDLLPAPYSSSPDTVPLPPAPDYLVKTGSGFVWDTAGYLVTNAHVVQDAEIINVFFADGTTLKARLVGSDRNSDLAVIKITPSEIPELRLQPVKTANSRNLQVGQRTIAIGNPFGLSGTMTEGIVSALGRNLPVESETGGQTYTIPGVIQTDAAINPGNSGGVLLNQKGEVIGVPAAIESAVNSNAGVGFAIPINLVKRVVPEIIAKGSYAYPWLGVAAIGLTPEIIVASHFNKGQTGILIQSILPDSPAAAAQLQGGSGDAVDLDGQKVYLGGDLLLAIDGHRLQRFDDLATYLSQEAEVGKTVSVTLLRQQEKITLPLTLTGRPVASQETPKTAVVSLGIQGTDLTPPLAEAMNIHPSQQGVLLVTVAPDSTLAVAGLRGSQTMVRFGEEEFPLGGDVIIGWNLQAITGMADLIKVLPLYEPGEVVLLTILREGQEFFVQVPLAPK